MSTNTNTTPQSVDKSTLAPEPYVLSPELHGQLHRLHNALSAMVPDGPDVNGYADMRGHHLSIALGRALVALCDANPELARLCPVPKRGRASRPQDRCTRLVDSWSVAVGHEVTEDYEYHDDPDAAGDYLRPVVTYQPLTEATR